VIFASFLIAKCYLQDQMGQTDCYSRKKGNNPNVSSKKKKKKKKKFYSEYIEEENPSLLSLSCFSPLLRDHNVGILSEEKKIAAGVVVTSQSSLSIRTTELVH
jgi:hypothetical protein